MKRELVSHTASWAMSAVDQTWIAYWPPDAREDIAGLVPSNAVLFPQTEGNLGRRLRHAVGTVADVHHGSLAVIGTDAPLLGPGQLRAAFSTLADGHDACIAPGLDGGGYRLIALARPIGLPFHLPPQSWRGLRVLELTLKLLDGAEHRTAQLPAVINLDLPNDALRLLADPGCPPGVRSVLMRCAAATFWNGLCASEAADYGTERR